VVKLRVRKNNHSIVTRFHTLVFQAVTLKSVDIIIKEINHGY